MQSNAIGSILNIKTLVNMPFQRKLSINGNTQFGVASGILPLVPGADLPNYPMRFSGIYSYLATVAHGGNVQSNTGKDIFFTSDAAGLNRLNFELVAYNPVNGAIEAYVQIPLLLGANGTGGSTILYIWYGQNNTTNLSNRTGTWNSDYAAVFHFGDGTTLDLTDSTANHNDGTDVNGVTAAGSLLPDNTNNFIGGSASFSNALSQIVDCGANASIQLTGNPGIVILATIKIATTASAGQDRGIIGNINSGFTNGYGLFQHRNTNPNNQTGISVQGAGGAFFVGGGTLNNIGVTAFLIAICNPNDANVLMRIFYWDTNTNIGSGGNTGFAANHLGASGIDLVIGRGQSPNWDFFDGQIDEIRVMNTPANFPFNATTNNIPRINIEVNNFFQTNAFPFYNIGAEVAFPALALTCSNLLPGIKGFIYSVVLGASGGIPPYTFAVTSGSLPPGLMFDPINPGFIIGTPTQTGHFVFDVTVTDSVGATSVCHAMVINIFAPPTNLSLVLNPRKLPFTYKGPRHTEGRHYLK